MLREIPSRLWNSSKRVTPRKASRTMSMLHHSPTTSRHWATEQSKPAKLLRSIAPSLLSCIIERNPLEWRAVTQVTSTLEPQVQATPRQRPRVVFLVTALGAFMASLDLSIVNVAFPALERSFPHDPSAALAWVIIGYGIVFGSLLVIAGRTADRLGSRRVFFAGLGVFCLGSALCGFAPSVLLLVFGRLIQGVGAAALLPASLSLLLDAFPVERRSQVVALWGGVGALAVATGPSFGAALITIGGWRWAFFVNLPIGALAWLAGRRVLSKTVPRRPDAKPDYLGALLIGGHAGVPGARHLAGADMGLGELANHRVLRGRARRRGRLSVPLRASSRTGARPDVVQDALVQCCQPRNVPLRHGLLRDAARQHPVPDQRLALLDTHGRALR